MASNNVSGRLRAIIFDNNGTPFDDLTSVAYPCAAHIFRAYLVKPPSLETYRNEMSANFFEFYQRHGFDKLPYVTQEDLNKIRRRYYEIHGHLAHYRPEFEPLLRELKKHGIRVAMCSAEIPATLVRSLERAKLLDLFDEGMVRGGAWPSKTPVLAELVQQMGLTDPSEAAYIDDSDDGIAAAKAAGLMTFGFSHPTGYASAKRIEAARPTHIVRSFSELRTRLRQMIANS